MAGMLVRDAVYFVITAIVVISNTTHANVDISTARFTRTMNTRHAVLTDLTNSSSRFQCCVRCLEDTQCAGVSYNPVLKECATSMVKATPANTLTETGWVLYEKDWSLVFYVFLRTPCTNRGLTHAVMSHHATQLEPGRYEVSVTDSTSTNLTISHPNHADVVVDIPAPSTELVVKTDECATHFGYSFIFGFMTNKMTGNGVPYILVAAKDPTLIRVRIPFLSIDEQHLVNTSIQLQYSSTLVMDDADNITINKGVEVTSELRVSLYYVNRGTDSIGGGVVLSESMLGVEYVTTPVSPNAPALQGIGQFLVVGTVDGTIVTLEHMENTTVIVLNRFDVYQVQSNHRNGRNITSTAPINVHVGHSCVFIPGENSLSCDMLSTAVPPLHALQKNYIIPYMRQEPTFTFRAYAIQDSTNVDIYDEDSNLVAVRTINKWWGASSMRLNLTNKARVIRASTTVLVTQFGYSKGDNYFGDPSQTFVPGLQHYTNWFSFIVPSFFDNPSILCIVIKAVDAAGLRLNGVAIATTEVVNIKLPPFNVQYQAVYADVLSGVQYSITSIDPLAKFTAFFYGKEPNAEFATSLGYQI